MKPVFPRAECSFNESKTRFAKIWYDWESAKVKIQQGSDWIIKVLEEKDERPLWICVWGGANTLAQALYKIKQIKRQQKLKN